MAETESRSMIVRMVNYHPVIMFSSSAVRDYVSQTYELDRIILVR